MATLVARIDGVDYPIEADTFRVDDRVDEPSTCTLAIITPDGLHLDQGEPVEVWWDDSELLFSGAIAEPVEALWSPEQGLIHYLALEDWHYLAARRIVARGWTDTTCGDVIRDVIDEYLAADGVTEGDIADGMHMEIAQANYVPATVVLDRMAQMAGFWWTIDAEKKLHFQPYEARVAPWHITPDDDGGYSALAPDVRVERVNGNYRNRQYVRGVRDVTDVLVERHVADGQAQSWTVAYPLALEPTIKVDGVPQTVGVRGIDDAAELDFYWSYASPVISQRLGLTPPTVGDVVEITYQGLFDVVVVSHDPDAVAHRQDVEGFGTGLVDAVVEEPDLASRMAAFDHAAAMLARYARPGRKLIYRTDRPGLAPGQLQTVTIPRHDLVDAEMLIERVDPQVTGGRLEWTVTAVQGPIEGSWLKFFRLLAQQPKVLVWRENISEEEVLVRLLGPFHRDWVEEDRPNMFLEPLPDGSWLPDGSVTPAFRHDDRIRYVQLHLDDETVLRKIITQRSGLDTDEVSSVAFIAPMEALGHVDDVSWWGGLHATDEVDSGVEVDRETVDEDKTTAEAWQLTRTDAKDWN